MLILSGCSPEYDWREVRGTDIPFLVTMPAKPATHSRSINLDGMAVTMNMTAAQVNDVVYAVGSARLPDSASGKLALQAMKTAMVRNIQGTVLEEKVLPQTGSQAQALQIEASGSQRLLLARFIAREDRIYQVVVLGPEQQISREAAGTFLASFTAY